MPDDICGHPTAEDGSPCQTPAHLCQWHDPDADDPDNGRPAVFDDKLARQRVLVAVSDGLKVQQQAALAGVPPNTLRRALCCVDTPSDPVLTTDDPCDFCGNYAEAHANGAREVLNDCRPEFIASASYGYIKEERRDITSTDGSLDLSITFSDDGDE